MRELIRRKVLPVCLVILAGIGGVWVKAVVEADRSIEQAEQLEKNGDLEFAIVCYRRTIRWYSPGSGAVKTAIDRLLALGASFEKTGNPLQALLAYRAIRTGLLGVQSLFQPHADALEKANAHIAVLMANQLVGSTSDASIQAELNVELVRHEELLAKTSSPHVGWSLAALVSFLFWCFSLFSLAKKGFSPSDGRINKPLAFRWVLVWLITGALWMTALSLA